MRDQRQSGRRTLRRAAAFLGVAAVILATIAVPRAQTRSDAQIRADIERHIHDLLGSSRISVTVAGHVVTLDGTVPNLWTKRQIIERSRKTAGVEEVDSTLEIAQGENDARLAERSASGCDRMRYTRSSTMSTAGWSTAS